MHIVEFHDTVQIASQCEKILSFKLIMIIIKPYKLKRMK